MVAVTTPPSDPTVVPGTVFDLQPDGITFAAPVALTLTYDPAQLPADADEQNLALGHLIDGVWTVVTGSIVNTTAHTVSGPIPGFSLWAIIIIKIAPLELSDSI